jgi:hypothetical protein
MCDTYDDGGDTHNVHIEIRDNRPYYRESTSWSDR